MALPAANQKMIREGVKLILTGLGEDITRSGLADTPARVAKLYGDVMDGNYVDMPRMTSFEGETYNGAVMVHHVPFYALCEHHLLMFQGHFGMAYVPGKRILGLSKLVRIFRHFCKRPTVQERITEQAVDALMSIAEPLGAIVYVTAEHTCMTLRGVKSPGSMTTTVAHRGSFANDQEMRQQFIAEASR